MANDRLNHPCFNANVRHQYGRIHLPVAPKCNILCNFCNRKFDCVNESRPGVTSKVLSPGQALIYVDKYLKINPQISTIGIAGPGDPLANPDETLETIHLVHEKHPELLFCLSTNGLKLFPHIKDLAELGVTHITVTVNAVNPEIGAKVYAWVRDGKVIYRGVDGAKLLMERQLEAIPELKKYGMTVKVNSIIIPEVNDSHLPVIAEKVAALGADVMNCIPLIPASGSNFQDLTAPTLENVKQVREVAEKFISQMKHCARCRADAAGLLGAAMDRNSFDLLEEIANLPLNPEQQRPYIAVATMEGLLINQHLGEATRLHIFRATATGAELVEVRPTPEPGNGLHRWNALSQLLADCHTLLVSGIGESPSKVLKDKGVKIYETEGLIEAAISSLSTGQGLIKKVCLSQCGFSCKGDGTGCG